MTRSLTAATEAGRATRPLTFVLRKFARLLPAALTTIVLTVAVVVSFTPPRFWGTLIDQAVAAATYTMNFWLQDQAVDYYAVARFDSSFFQHFWSLSIQGQIFIVWPILHLIGVFVAKRMGVRPRFVLLAIFGAVTVASFAFAIWFTGTNQVLAYFDTLARSWEFAIGSVLALVMPWLRIPVLARRLMTAAGIIGACLAGVVLPVAATFPGWAALWPVACAVLVIAAADAPKPAGVRPDPILGHRVLQVIGNYTYALYLTHWPVLVLYSQITGHNVPGIRHGLLVLLVSAAAAFLITTLVEQPIARWMAGERVWGRWLLPRIGRRTIGVVAVGALLMTIGGVGGSTWYRVSTDRAYEEIWTASVANRGPQADPGATFTSLLPADVTIQKPADAPGERCPDDDPWLSSLCLEAGDPQGERSVVMIGSSHIMAYSGMVWETMTQQEEPAYMRMYGAPGCLFFGTEVTAETPCGEAWRTGIDYVLENQPDVLIVLGTISREDQPDVLQDGTVARTFDTVLADIRPLVELVNTTTTTEVVVLRDVPRFPSEPYDCGATYGFSSPECVYPLYGPPPELAPFVESIEQLGGVWVDLQATICPHDECRPSMGGLVTYVDNSHISATFARSLAHALADQVHPHIDWWPAEVWPPLES